MAYQQAKDKKAAVRQVQRILRDRAYYGSGTAELPVDGDYGEDTRQAVRDFQGALGIGVTGVVDLRTWRLLQIERQFLADRLLPSSATVLFPSVYEYVPAEGSEDSFIRLLQVMLEALGGQYGWGGNLPATGIYDTKTREAVATFQRKNGLTPDARLTAETRRRIGEDYEKQLLDSK